MRGPTEYSVRAEYDFRNRKQGATETVTNYLTALRTLHIDCERPEQESHNLAMQLALRMLQPAHSRKASDRNRRRSRSFCTNHAGGRDSSGVLRGHSTRLRLLLLPIHHVRRANLLTSAALDVGHHLKQYINCA